jgi:hypothetical protein
MSARFDPQGRHVRPPAVMTSRRQTAGEAVDRIRADQGALRPVGRAL